ncbi:MAG: DNA recombination protein RmuC [Planctomycetota bacterium]|jgi:DNA recombination protein RmuC
MEWMPLAVVGVLILFMLGLLIWLISVTFAGRREIAGQAAGIGLLQQQLEALKAAQDNIREALQKSLQTGQESISQNLQSSQQVLTRLNTQIGELQGTNKQMLQVGTEVRRLQDILSSPKLRGQMGEWSLENLLAGILPKGSYELQYTFQDGRIVDALVKFEDYSVP